MQRRFFASRVAGASGRDHGSHNMSKRISLVFPVVATMLVGCDEPAAVVEAARRGPEPAAMSVPQGDPSPPTPAPAPRELDMPADTRAAEGPRLPSTDSTWWGDAEAQFAEFNGDGALDLFGWISEGDQSQVAAFDGATGRGLWRAPVRATDWSSSRVALVAGHIVVVDSAGKALAFKPGDEAPLWTVELGERAQEVCKGLAGQVVIRTKDGRISALGLATGSVSPGTMPRMCATDAAALPAAIRTRHTGFQEIRRRTRFSAGRVPVVPDVDVEAVLTIGPKQHVVLGHKTPGTRVPMIAVTQDQRVVWSSQVPESDALAARTSGDNISAADDRAAFVFYDSGSGRRIAALAIGDGRRLWDVEVEADVDSLVPVQNRLYVAQTWSISALDRETGEHLYTIGRD